MLDSRLPVLVRRMQFFYELFPYPNRFLLWMPNPKYHLQAHAAHYREGQITPTCATMSKEMFHMQLDSQIASDFKILLAGCGTDEPVLMRRLHRNAQITAVDLSKRSLNKARIKLLASKLLVFMQKMYFEKNVTLIHSDLVSFLQCGQKYDHIQCFGVLHHQPDPLALLDKLVMRLHVGGSIRIMIYSANGRAAERWVQRRSLSAWSKISEPKNSWQRIQSVMLIKFKQKKLVLWNLLIRPFQSVHSRFRYLRSNMLADALLHPSDPGFAPSALKHADLKMTSCQSKCDVLGILDAKGSDTAAVWEKILDSESKSNLINNIIVTFTKTQK